jgi:hypothetical protein
METRQTNKRQNRFMEEEIGLYGSKNKGFSFLGAILDFDAIW